MLTSRALRFRVLAALGLGGVAAAVVTGSSSCCPPIDYSDVPPERVVLSDTCAATVSNGDRFSEHCRNLEGDTCPPFEVAFDAGQQQAQCFVRRIDPPTTAGGGGQTAAGGSSADGGSSAVGGQGGEPAAGGQGGVPGAGGEGGVGGDAPSPTVWSSCCYGVITPPGGQGCGRPFLVDGRPMYAALVERDDWRGAPVPRAEPLSETERDELAARWARDAQFEHASVAAFARFAMDLLRLGAPSDLVDAATQAMRDEIDHARRCFALASRYAARPLGPGPLPMGPREADDLVTVALRAFEEGCLGETSATLIAAQTLACTRDPLAREALEVIASDEADHALLAFRFLAWAARDAAVHAALSEAVSRLSSTRAPASRPDIEPLVRHGQLSERARAAIAHESLVDVALPSVRAMLASVQPVAFAAESAPLSRLLAPPVA